MGIVLCPVCPNPGDNICLSLPTVVYFQKRRAQKRSVGESLLMSGASVCCNPLGQQFVLSVHCVKFVSVASPVSLFLLAEMSSSSNECVSESDSNISSVMSWSIKFLFVAILINAI